MRPQTKAAASVLAILALGGAHLVRAQGPGSDLAIVHPLATAALGSLVTSYDYAERLTPGAVIFHRDERTSSTFYSLAGGGEVNVLSWMRATMTIGYRSAGATTLPNRTASNSGLVITSLVELGKF